jgi:hypothetical protein
MLCDDENVEPIQEADLVRYFGEYQAGAGYVLFYQAADIDLASLGLPEQEPPKAAAAMEEHAPMSFSVPVSAPVATPVSAPVSRPAPPPIPAPVPAPIPAPVVIAEPLPVRARAPVEQFLQPRRSPAAPDPLSPTFSQVGPMLDIDPMETAMSPHERVLAALSDYRSGDYESQTPESMTPPMLSPALDNTDHGRPRTSSSASALAPGAIRIGQDRVRASSPPSSYMGGFTPARQTSVSSASKSGKTGNWLSRRTSSRDEEKDRSKRTSVYESSRPSTSRTESSSQAGFGLNGGANDFRASDRKATDTTSSSATGLGLTVPRTTNGNHSNGTTPGTRSRSHTTDTSTSALTTPSRNLSGSFASYESSTTGSVPNSAPASRGSALLYQQQQSSTSPTPNSSSSPAVGKGSSSSASSFGGLGLGKKKDEKEKPRTPSGGSGMLKRSLSGVSMKPMLSRSSSSVLGKMMGMGKKDRDNTLESVSERR